MTLFSGIVCAVCVVLAFFCDHKRTELMKNEFVANVVAGKCAKPRWPHEPPAWRKYRDARNEEITFGLGAAIALLFALGIF